MFCLTSYCSIFLFIKIELYLGQKVVGKMAMIFGIATHIAPAQNIFEVWKKGDYRLIPIHTVLVGLSSSVSWLVFSILIWDFNSIIPKSISTFFGVLNTITYMYQSVGRVAITVPYDINNPEKKYHMTI